ncbi:hypothetical protein P691DRAFT_645703, partial [Macrolepiota fuliginosa MF-IS2]
GALVLAQADVDQLQPGQMLNDNLVEFGLRYEWDAIKRCEPEIAELSYVFNTFFYQHL